MVHGDAELQKAERATQVLFGGSLAEATADDILTVFDDAPSVGISRGTLQSRGHRGGRGGRDVHAGRFEERGRAPDPAGRTLRERCPRHGREGAPGARAQHRRKSHRAPEGAAGASASCGSNRFGTRYLTGPLASPLYSVDGRPPPPLRRPATKKSKRGLTAGRPVCRLGNALDVMPRSTGIATAR